MANLIENPEWTAGIYQLEQDDLVLGGPDGIDNVQAKQLANRSFWLKQQVESAQGEMVNHVAAVDPHPQYATDIDLAAAIAALVNSSPAMLDTLAEIATALSNDPNFATTITNALALKAPLASPALTGTPTAPTAAQFNNSTLLATTAFVKAALGSLAGSIGITINTTLGASHWGKRLEIAGTPTITLPLASSVPSGTAVILSGNPASDITFAMSGADILYINNTATTTPYLASRGFTGLLMSDSAGWRWVLGTEELRTSPLFGSSLAASGYQKLPSGLIIQWGSVVANPTTDTSWTYPVAFPNAVYAVFATSSFTGLNYKASSTDVPGLTSAKFRTEVVSGLVYVLSIGK